MIECRAPKNPQELEKYYQLRWQVLREPWQQAKGSEQDELEAQAIHRLIINESDEVIAVGRLHFTENNSAQIRYMAVAPAFAGQGFGRQIINALEQVAINFGASTIELNAREQALGFYQQLGYQGNKISHLLYGQIKHIAMKKVIMANANYQAADVNELVKLWHKTIPLSKAMGIAITRYDEQALVATCDLSFNKNIHHTMFAGSIYTLATLTGWGLIHLALKAQALAGDVVLAEANVKYMAPIEGVAYARVDNSELKFTRLLAQKNERIVLTVNVLSGEKIAAHFNATYVVKPKREI
ncbi:MAG: YiiD C-terminal domain-containing protein [Thalassotalea sp.]